MNPKDKDTSVPAQRFVSIPPQGGSGLQHQHMFQITSAEGIIMRMCRGCGKTWILNRPNAPDLSEWIEVGEKEQ